MNRFLLLGTILFVSGILFSLEESDFLDRINRDYISGDYKEAYSGINSYLDSIDRDSISAKVKVLGEKIYYFYIQTEITSENQDKISTIYRYIDKFPDIGSNRVRDLLSGLNSSKNLKSSIIEEHKTDITSDEILFDESREYTQEELTLLLKTTLLEGKKNSVILQKVIFLLTIFTIFGAILFIGILLSYLYLRKRVKRGRATILSPILIGSKDDDIGNLNGLIEECKVYSKKIDLVTGRKNNSENIADIVFKISKEAGFSDHDALLNYSASLIYDIGLLSVDESILKSESITEDEFHIIQNHVKVGLQLIPFIPPKYIEMFSDAILKHHENIDGSGYPNRLQGDEIPILPRIIRVVESYISLISKREYKIICDKEAALLHLRREVNKYDQFYVDLLDRVM